MKKTLFVILLVILSSQLVLATVHVSKPTYLTNHPKYDRNPAPFFDGSNYWLFYTKADSGIGIRGVSSYDPDSDAYSVFYKTASSPEALASAPEQQIGVSYTNRPAGFSQRVASGIVFSDGSILVIVSSGQDGTDKNFYKYTYNPTTYQWSGPTQIVPVSGTITGGHVRTYYDGSTIYMVWEGTDGNSYFSKSTDNGATWTTPVQISTDNQPAITKSGGTLYVVSISDTANNPIRLYRSTDDGATWDTGTDVDNLEGFYDPYIFVHLGALYVLSAPYDDVTDEQHIMITKSTDGLTGATWTTATPVTSGGYGSTKWWDFWPVGLSDGTNAYLFYTTEKEGTQLGDGEIALFKLDWDITEEHYEAIQPAIDSATDNTIIKVSEGTYYENVVINKPVNLSGGSRPKIDGSRLGPCITISADAVIVSRFELTNGTNGISSSDTDGTTISNCSIHHNYNVNGYEGAGIMFWSGPGASIIDDFDNNSILNNEIYSNDRQGIYLGGSYDDSILSENNRIEGNKIYNNGLNTYAQGPDNSAYGIQLSFADNNDIIDNEIYNHRWNYSPTFPFGQGIYLNNAYYNNVTMNNIYGNDYGVAQYSDGRAPSQTNYLSNNKISGNIYFGVRNFDTNPTLNAEHNWWGAPDGPSHSPGSGDKVEGNVDYDPWWANEDMTLEGTEESQAIGNCDDGFDNDYDGFADCEDPDCDGATVACGSGACEGTKVCEAGTWTPCSTFGEPCDDGLWCNGADECDADGNCVNIGPPVDCDDGIGCTLDSCDEANDKCLNQPDDSVCDDGLWCNGAEYCDAVLDCQPGTPPDCSVNDLAEVNTCTYYPDGNEFTLDYRPAFTSTCDEVNDECTTGNSSITHTCSIAECGAECESDDDCQATECDYLDGCYDGTYRDYHDVANSCLSVCTCTHNSCDAYDTQETDNDGDGYDIECDNECDDTNASINPGAIEKCNGVDDNCNGVVDEGFTDTDSDGTADCVDDDDDNDGIPDEQDPRPLIPNEPPVTSITAPAENSWHSTDFSVTIEDTDADGDSITCEYRVLAKHIGEWEVTRDWTPRECNSDVLITVGWNEDGSPKDCPYQGYGYCEVEARATDEWGASQTQETRRFSIDWTGPRIREISPRDGSVTGDTSPRIEARYSDRYSGINQQSVRLWLDGVEKTQDCNIGANSVVYQMNSFASDGSDDGVHTIKVYVEDMLGNQAELEWNFTLDTAIPGVKIILPEYTKYDTRRLMVEVETDERVKRIRAIRNSGRAIVLCRDCDYVKKGVTFFEGNNTLRVEAEDYAGNVGTAETEFYIDSKKPRVHKTWPRDGTYVQGTEFGIKYTESNLQEVRLKWTPSSTGVEQTEVLSSCLPGRAKQCSLHLDLSGYDGQTIQYYFELDDGVNIARSSTKSVYVDNTAPQPNITSPTNGALLNSRRVYLSVDILNNEPALLEYAVDGSGYRRLCSGCTDYFGWKTLRDGFHILSVRATDKAGNSATEQIGFAIDSKPPRIRRIEPYRGYATGEFRVTYTEEALKSVTLHYGTESMTRLDCPSGTRMSCTFNIPNLDDYDNSILEYWFELEDWAGNIARSRTRKLKVDTTAPQIDVTLPEQWGIYTRRVPFRVRLSERVARLYYIDAYDLRERTLCRGCTYYTHRGLPFTRDITTPHNITIYAVDYAGNQANPVQRAFTVI